MGLDSADPEVPVNAVGRRVSRGGDRATVRYVGLVPPNNGLWLGVEWDDPERGKHDGSHEGVQYFTCRHPTAGSFVRPAKVSFGSDYLGVVQQVYENNSEEILSKKISVSHKELVWQVFEPRLEKLSTVVLHCHDVNGPGAAGEIRKRTPNVEWLDLSRSLLPGWKDVAAISEQLDKLEGLQLSFNRLHLPSEPSAYRHAFCHLKVLAINDCALTWTQILECAPMWPSLEELSARENGITELCRPEGVLQCLKCLNLSCNPLVQESVLTLSALQRLTNLNLSSTGLSVIQFEDAPPGGQTAMFPNLETLLLANNNISEWCVVDELGKLPSLVKLSVLGNRLVSSDGNPKTANQMLIAKLGQLLFINNCEITSEERRGAELDYLKMFGDEWLKAKEPGQSMWQFTRQHPRYQKLVDKYGAPEEGELKKPEMFALKNHLLKVTFVFPDDPDRKPIEKKLPASMVVQRMKQLLWRQLKIPQECLRLTYTSPKVLGTEFEINNDLKTLHFYSIEEGDQVLVRWS